MVRRDARHVAQEDEDSVHLVRQGREPDLQGGREPVAVSRVGDPSEIQTVEGGPDHVGMGTEHGHHRPEPGVEGGLRRVAHEGLAPPGLKQLRACAEPGPTSGREDDNADVRHRRRPYRRRSAAEGARRSP